MVASRKQRGFTLIEMMIVISMILILLSIAIPNYKRVIVITRETQLKQDLSMLRKQITAYTYDKKRAPQSLDDLVSDGYLMSIPTDPFTHRSDWLAQPEQPDRIVDLNQPGIFNVHSSSQLVGLDGTAYNTW